MDIRDFEGNFKFKLIIPIIYIINWLLMFLGPSLFPVQYQYYGFALYAYLLVRCTYMLIGMLLVTIKTFTMYLGQKSNKQEIGPLDEKIQYDQQRNQIFEAFIIPNYKQDIQLLSDTIKWIASHKDAKERYLVFLAMQKHQQNSQLKALELIQNFREKFKVMQYTLHQIRQNQQKGKASNVSWCGEHLEIFFQKYNINPDNVMLTIIDADSWIPPLYIQKMEEALLQKYQEKDQTIFVPPQIFTRNYLDVPIFVRVYDQYHSLGHISNLVSIVGINFALSNYSISYNLIKKIGFWDTCEDAIGQDFHTTLKAFWKTRGQIKSKTIFVPFNQVNIQTGNGYLCDIQARFWQAERHGRGVADIAYNINMMLSTKFINWRAFGMMLFGFDTFFLPATVPWVGISTLYQQVILYQLKKPSPEIYDSTINSYVFMILLVLTVLTWALFESMKRYLNKKIYKQENQSLIRLLEVPILVAFILSFMSIPAFIISSFGVLFKARPYRVAEKVLNKPELTES